MLYFFILRISIAERLVYRVDFALGTLMRFLPVVTQIFLWDAIFQGMASGGKTIVGYNYHELIAYYLLTMVGRAFSSMPGLASSIARDIRDGTIKKYLLQPVDMLSFVMMSRLAHKLVYYAVAVCSVCLGLLDLPRLLQRLAGRVDHAGLRRVAADVVPAGLLPGGHAGHDRLLVPGGQLAFVRLHAPEFLLLGPDVPAGHDAFLLADGDEDHPAAIPGLFPRGRVFAEGHRRELAWGLAAEAFWVVFFYVTARTMFHYGVRRVQRFRRLIGMGNIAAYFRVFLTFARNSLVRDMTFRGNFIIDADHLDGLDVPEPDLLPAGVPLYQFDRQEHGLGAIPVLHVFRHQPGHQRRGAERSS